MKLYGTETSPYVRKVRIVLREKSIPCQFIEQGASAPGSRVPELNPLGKVPVMELDNGEVLFDSPLLVEYLDSLKGEPLIPPVGEQRWRVLRWHALGQGITDAVVTRMLERRRPPEHQSADVITRQEGKIVRALEYANQADKGEAYLIGDQFSLADIALGVALEYIDFRYDHDWRARHSRLALWLAGIGTRPSFAETQAPGVEKAVDAPH